MEIHKKCSQNAMATTIRPSVLTAFSHLEDRAEISIIEPEAKLVSVTRHM